MLWFMQKPVAWAESSLDLGQSVVAFRAVDGALLIDCGALRGGRVPRRHQVERPAPYGVLADLHPAARELGQYIESHCDAGLALAVWEDGAVGTDAVPTT